MYKGVSILLLVLSLSSHGRHHCPSCLLWSPDVVVSSFFNCVSADTHPSRYMFVHHCDCEHYLIVSDIRLEPAPYVQAAIATTIPTSVDHASGRHGRASDAISDLTSDYSSEQQGPGCIAESYSLPTNGPGNESIITNAQSSSSSVEDRVPSSTETAEDGQRPADGTMEMEGVRGTDSYPRLSYRAKPNLKRCSICTARVATYRSFGHPLADEARMDRCVKLVSQEGPCHV